MSLAKKGYDFAMLWTRSIVCTSQECQEPVAVLEGGCDEPRAGIIFVALEAGADEVEDWAGPPRSGGRI